MRWRLARAGEVEFLTARFTKTLEQQVILDITSIVSACAVVVGLVFAGTQALALVRQLRSANIIAGTSERRGLLANLTPVYDHLIETPELRAYFYGNKILTDDDPSRDKVLLIAEMFCDALDLGLFTTAKIESTESSEDWRRYVTDMLNGSAVLRGHVNPDWWPYLGRLNSALETGDKVATPLEISGGPPDEFAPELEGEARVDKLLPE